ncbi:hypothetical protein EHQ61_16825 [Leptospira wolffii]|nr:hypothetical protein EHQ61_16825 [Leptospira wolffii]
MMLYIALALILVGILCFIYVSFQAGPKTESGGTGFARGNGSSYPQRERKHSQEALASLRKTNRSESHSQMDQVFAEERKILVGSSKTRLEFPEEPEETMEEIVTHPLSEHEEDRNRKEIKEEVVMQETPKEEEWSMEGILFLDLSGRLPYESLQERIRPENLKGFRRMGKGRIREIPGGFSFLAKNSEFSYKLDEVEKIVFYDQGFALLPLKREYPTPVFLTQETEKFKTYLDYTAKG